jgi:hypothetical protein
MYSVFIVPSIKYQLSDLSNKYGIVNLTIEAKYVNTTSNMILSKNTEFIPMIIIPSNVKLILFTVLLSFFGYYILDISGSQIKVKTLWKK